MKPKWKNVWNRSEQWFKRKYGKYVTRVHKKKRYIIDVLQGSEYSSGSEYTRILNMTGLHKVIKKCSTINAWNDSEYSWGCEYGRVLNMPGLHKVLNKRLHYRYLIGFWICLLFLNGKVTEICELWVLLRSKPVQRNYRHFFEDFIPKSAFYELIKLRVLVKTLLMEIIWGLKVTMNQITTKKTCFGYFCWSVTLALTLRPRIDRVYTSFEHSLVFAIFKPLPVGFRS